MSKSGTPQTNRKSDGKKVDITLEGLPYELCTQGTPDNGEEVLSQTDVQNSKYEPVLSLSPRSSRSCSPLTLSRKQSSGSGSGNGCDYSGTPPAKRRIESTNSLSPLGIRRTAQLYRSDSGSSLSSCSSAQLSPICRRLSRSNCTSSGSDSPLPTNGIDIKTGRLTYVIGDSEDDVKNAPAVYVKVLGNEYEHHAQIYTDSDFMHQLEYISLRNCDIRLDGKDLTCINIEDKNDRTESRKCLKFIAASEKEAAVWVKAFIPKNALPLRSDLSPVLNRHGGCSPERKPSA